MATIPTSKVHFSIQRVDIPWFLRKGFSIKARSATQRVLQLDPVAAFLSRGGVQDDGAPLVVQRFPVGAEGRGKPSGVM